MSVVLCLPRSPVRVTRSVPWPAPHGNASKAFHRRRVNHPWRATRGHQPRAARRSSGQLAARSAAQQLAAQRSGSQRRPATAPSSSRSPQRRPEHRPDRAATVKEVDRPGFSHQRVLSADQQGRTPSRVNHLHNHRLTSTSRTPSPVLQNPPQQPPQDHPIESTDGALGQGG